MPIPVFSVDVDDAKFKAFQASFNKYNEMLGKMPGAWGKINKASSEVSDNFKAMSAALLAQNELLKGYDKGVTKLNQGLSGTQRSLSGLARDSAHFARNIGEATLSLLKWAGITSALGGLLGAGGIWGIDRLAQSASTARRSAGGIGTTPGAQQAFAINYGRFVDPNAMLSNVANARSDYSKRYAFGSLGISGIEGKDPTQLAVEIIDAAKKLWDNSDKSEQTFKARGLDQFMSFEEWRRTGGSSAEEIAAQKAAFNKDKTALELNPQQSLAWQNFKTQLERAGASIERTFITALAPLAPELTELSKAFEGGIKSLLESDNAKEAVKWMATEIKSFTGYIASPAFKDDMHNFVKGLSDAVKAIQDFVAWVRGLGFGKPQVAVEAHKVWERMYRDKNPGGLGDGDLWRNFGAYGPGGNALRVGDVNWLGGDPMRGGNPLLPQLPGAGGGAPGLGTRISNAMRKWLGEHGAAQSGYAADGTALNNPGNLSSWFGVPQANVRMNNGTMRKFAQFPSVEAGIAALGDQLRLYQNRDHIDTLRGIIGKYSPANENDTKQLIANAERTTGYKADDHLNLNDSAVLSRVLAAILRNENKGWGDLSPDRVEIIVNNNTGGSAVVTGSQIAVQQ